MKYTKEYLQELSIGKLLITHDGLWFDVIETGQAERLDLINFDLVNNELKTRGYVFNRRKRVIAISGG